MDSVDSALHITRPVTTSMFVDSLVFMLAVHSASGQRIVNSGYCRNSGHSDRPVITVANSTHLRINWENSFKGCDGIEVDSASLRIQRKSSNYESKREWISVNFGDKKVDVEADPCLRHDRIRVKLKYTYKSDNFEVQSSHSSYNPYSCSNIRPQDLYSGLLQEQVLDRICKKENGEFLIPDIPKEIQKCVKKRDVDEASSKLSFDIVSPCTKDKTDVVEGALREVNCTHVVTEGEKKEASVSQNGDLLSPTKIGLIIGIPILVIIIVTVVACVTCSKKNQKKEQEGQQDVNPVYEGAADYEYDDMGNYDATEQFDSNEVSSAPKKEVKAEVVDRNSIYGESEEGGWENAVIVDNNQYYESNVSSLVV